MWDLRTHFFLQNMVEHLLKHLYLFTLTLPFIHIWCTYCKLFHLPVILIPSETFKYNFFYLYFCHVLFCFSILLWTPLTHFSQLPARVGFLAEVLIHVPYGPLSHVTLKLWRQIMKVLMCTACIDEDSELPYRSYCVIVGSPPGLWYVELRSKCNPLEM